MLKLVLKVTFSNVNIYKTMTLNINTNIGVYNIVIKVSQVPPRLSFIFVKSLLRKVIDRFDHNNGFRNSGDKFIRSSNF